MPRKSFPTTPKSLSDHLFVKRVEKGLSQAETAEKLGVAKSKVRLWEMDAELPTEREWQAIQILLGIDAGLKPMEPNT